MMKPSTSVLTEGGLTVKLRLERNCPSRLRHQMVASLGLVGLVLGDAKHDCVERP